MQYALVTGAAKGIGKAISAELARRKFNLLLTDWDLEQLKISAAAIRQEYGVEVHEYVQDLSDAGAARNLKSWSFPYHDLLTVVVNNAGYGLNDPFEQLSIEEQFGIIDVNIKAQLAITHELLPVLRRKKSFLLNVCSTTVYQPVPYLAVYAASKAFVLSFNQSLRYELRGSTVSLSYLSPGSTDTDFVVRARMKPHTLKTAERFNMTPGAVAKIAIDGLFKGKEEIVPGFLNKLNARLPKFFPLPFIRKIAASIYEPRKAELQKDDKLKQSLIEEHLPI
ncbi:SDR family NAD(P)-dependent oxidoreductase [Terrimonas sp. NA20]|uniref:NADP-dependent 3-hydroxy acid dehydrogenase YdfG n=1 Tax=Terrimonas ginsenosidimutans TaxID=2908004 RepID=A0ABS9KLS8_9BACT|nr:SDR family NAD(P)-dependent oxidoreductase [Terrimonas ginsenosidimutans]MCG2613271.1 SDR family NAD(P)-dependent oxidoreductase [Terrimonas ginsenosidimutans]